MVKLKERIKDSEALKLLISSNRRIITDKIKQAVNLHEADYLKARREKKISLALLAYGFLAIAFSEVMSNNYLLVSALVALGLFIWLMIKSSRVISEFNQKFDAIAFPYSLALLNLIVERETDEENKADLSDLSNKKALKSFVESLKSTTALNLLTESELVTEAYNRVNLDSYYQGSYNDRAFTLAELDLRYETGSGKNRTVRQVFRGYFFSITLNKNIEGKTFITTDSDRSGFGHKGFFAKDDVPKETILEWNEFEELLQVSTTNEIEARYILTPDFMHDLHEWWKERKVKVRVVFHGQKLYVILPNAKMRMNVTVANLSDKEIEEYVFSVAEPMMHIIHLVDEVRL